jgi:hypothetical protein
MGIDRIGQGGPPVPVPEAGGPSRADPSGSPFRVPSAALDPVAGPQGASAPAASTALERLRAGEIDLGGYVDLKVDEATSHLSALPVDQLESIRDSLRERIVSDPSLVDLLQSATGETLSPQTPRGD